MPFDFPNTPAPGDTFEPIPGTIYTWDGLLWRIELVDTGGGGGGGGIAEAPTDGQQYGRQSATWTVVPAAETAADILTKLKTVDGSGSGLDADLLDGQDSTVFEVKANKAVVNGYASLDGSGRVPSTQLPSFVDEVVEFSSLSAFPSPGTVGIIYVALDTNKIYRWSGSTYIEISPSPGSTDSVPEGSVNLYYTNARAIAAAPVQSVAGRTGTVVLAKGDVGLTNVDNTSDVNKPVSTATQTALNLKADATSVPAGSTTLPLVDGTAAIGTSGAWARADHVHPTSGGGGTVTAVTGTAPVVSSGGTTPAISMAPATASANGYLASGDWSTFNGKLSDAPNDGNQYARYNASWQEVVVQQYGNFFNYMFNAGTVTPPASGTVRFNSTTPSAVTTIWLNYTTNDNIAVNLKTYFTNRVHLGDTFYFQDKDNINMWQMYKVTSWVDSGNYATLTVTYVSGGTALAAQRIVISRESAGADNPIGEAPTDGNPYVRQSAAWLNFSTAMAAKITGVNTAKITAASTAPSSPATGDLWVDTT